MSGPIQRIVVTLEASLENCASIDTAVRLGAQTKAPVHGVFVEDEELLQLPNLPFARRSRSQQASRHLRTKISSCICGQKPIGRDMSCSPQQSTTA
jgi:hypothetical protein